MDSYERVYPTVDELSKVNKNINCPECSAVFNSDSNLNLHLAKTHKKSHLLESNNTDKIYHCPIVTCCYNKNAHFKQLKSLKQHYLKVHSEKKYMCTSCQKGFSTEAFKNRHAEYCNVTFKCCDCNMYYNCYETLKTHSRRKKHNILDKVAYKKFMSSERLKNSKSDVLILSSKTRLLLPKPSNSMGMIVISNTSEEGSQTESTQHNSQETQTLLTTRIPQLTVETQTIGDFNSKKSENYSSILKSIKTQTFTASPKSVSCNTAFSLDELNVIDVKRNSSSTQTSVCSDSGNVTEIELNATDVERSSSSTQTSVYNDSDFLYSSSTSTHDSAYTDTSDLLMETFDPTFFNCNMETQTDFMFHDDLFRYCDDYANMCTQTCEDLFLGEMGLQSNIQTQTVFDDMLKSVESQTIMSQSKKIPLTCKDTSHIETQTDIYLKKIFEEINTYDFP